MKEKADRLDRLERYGLIDKAPYQENPIRYRYALAPAGADVLPILQALGAWSEKHIPGRWSSPKWFVTGQPAQFYPSSSRS